VDVVKGLIATYFIEAQPSPVVYGNHATADIEALIRRSQIELADYELKQGYLTLADKREMDKNVIDKVICTICAIANNGPNRMGKIIIGVTDKPSDAQRITELDKIIPKKVGSRFVVGVRREAIALTRSLEDYLATWKNAIKNSALTPALRDSVLASIDFNDFYGLGVIVITVPSQAEMSWLGDVTFRRESDNTVQVLAAKEVAALAKRF
jgi:predicted HTH transcriptional regulator